MAKIKPGPLGGGPKSVKITSRTSGTGEEGDVLTVTFCSFEDFPENWNSLTMKIGGQDYKVILSRNPDNAPYTSPLHPNEITLFQPLPATDVTLNKNGGNIAQICFDGTEMYKDIPYDFKEINVLESGSIEVHNMAGEPFEFKLCYSSFRDCGLPETIQNNVTTGLYIGHFPQTHRSLLYPAAFTGVNGPGPKYRSSLPVFYNPNLVGASPIKLIFTEAGWKQSSFMPPS